MSLNFTHCYHCSALTTIQRHTESFSIEFNEWAEEAKLNVGRARCGACVHQGVLYVAGGADSNVLDRFNPDTYQFEVLQINISLSGPCGLVCHNEEIFILSRNRVLRLNGEAAVQEREEDPFEEWTSSCHPISFGGRIHYVKNGRLLSHLPR